jgi:cell division septum initiation protein DivIVA
MAEPKEIRDAHDEARRIRHEAERRARDILDDARKQSAAMLAEARAVADAALEDAQRLRDALAKSTEALTGHAEQLVRDVQLAHRELLGSLRLPGVSERDAPRRKKPPSPDELFEPPDWIGPR